MRSTRLVHARCRRNPLASALSAALACAALIARPHAAARSDGDFGIPVQNCDDSGPGSLRDLVAQSVSGDHIVFPADIGCDLVTLTSGPIVIANDLGGHPITELQISGAGSAALTIDG